LRKSEYGTYLEPGLDSADGVDVRRKAVGREAHLELLGQVLTAPRAVQREIEVRRFADLVRHCGGGEVK
jgi:hypothetical protein